MIALAIGIVLLAGLAWIRRGHGGKFGQAIRWSDWHAWNDAVKYRERELSELKNMEPKP